MFRKASPVRQRVVCLALRFDDALLVVIAAGLADSVRCAHRAAVAALHERGTCHFVVAASSAVTASLGHFVFRANRHCYNPPLTYYNGFSFLRERQSLYRTARALVKHGKTRKIRLSPVSPLQIMFYSLAHPAGRHCVRTGS